MTRKREQLLEKNTTLGTISLHNTTTTTTTVDTLQLEPTNPTEEEEVDYATVGVSSPVADVISDIMSLNEEVEELDEDMMLVRNQLRKLAEIINHAQYEDIGEEDEYKAAAQLSVELLSDYRHFKAVETKLHGIIRSFEELRRERGFSDTPLQYMMQLPPLREGLGGGVWEHAAGEGKGAWLHVLPDGLTGKTNCEMRVERCLLREMIKYAEELQKRLVLH